MDGASPTIRIRALRDLDVDNVRIVGGSEADIRRELVADLVAIGAVDDEVEVSEGKAADATGDGAAAHEAQPAAPAEAEVSVGEDTAEAAPPAARRAKKR